MKKISPNALTNQRPEKSVPHPQVQRRPEDPAGAETKRFGKAAPPGAQVGEQLPPKKRGVPRFTHDEMLGIAARALADTYRKPKRKYAR